ncbi:HEAT repeat domain-containing protein [Parachlamydia sp. AcF125]|uniref:HEAT repeat domain-containing protein n=1 Tax=Parachlamydia sp. AcF125 TaxID=2795736 RepID=UPI001BC9812D|nr:HEAT repeat domain-containing protein [Parachlamydia sp. AcF125]MBS4168595.1 hypothetical protein [Parachlamydia sp. AcF125]
MDINVSFLSKADRVSDYIPGVSTVTNLIDLFQKCAVLPFKQKANISKSHYYSYLKQKSFSRCVVLLLPVIGNILVAIYDFAKGGPNYADAMPVDAQPAPLSTPNFSESGRPPKTNRGGIAIDIDRELGEHAESLMLGTNESRAKGGIYKKHSRALVAAGYPAEIAQGLVSVKKCKKEAGNLAEQPSLGIPDCCEHSLTPDLQTKLALNSPQASAKNIYLEQNAQLHVHSHAHSIIQYKTEPPLSQTELDPHNLANSLRNYYLSQKTISIFRIKTQQEWEFKVPLEEIYVRLGIIENKERKARDQALNKHSDYIQDERVPTYETIFEPKLEIKLEKLFEHKSLEKENAKKIYLQGSAGSGKSTLCHYIAYRWAKEELWQGVFACLFWIPLRNLTLRKYPEDKDYTPADLIAREYKGKIDRRVIDFCLKDPAFREKTLLVLDGYDELSAGAQGNNSLATAFKELKELFPHILITSRPGSCSFKSSCNLELLGFDKKGVDRYIDKFFTQVKAEEKKEKLRRLLKSSPQVSSLARIPMLLILLCCLFHEDPKFFNSNHPITMSAIYARVVSWMYKWFLLRRIDQGKSKQTKEQVLSEKKLRQNPEVAKIATTFEEMADFAMKKDTLYLSKQEIEDFRGDKISSNELADCGLMRIPEEETEAEEKGYFIHLTFQEFLTASKVANQYLKGERQACQEFVCNYKFEPRYGLVLHMIAGYLSLVASNNRRYADALQSFFDDLFSEPKDLAVRSELNLIAGCFDECQNPAMVKQYEGFIELVRDYMAHLSLLDLNFAYLLKNEKIFNHSSVTAFIKGALSNPKIRRKMLINLQEAISTEQRLAPDIVRLIIEMFKRLHNDNHPTALYALSVLKAVAEQEGGLPKGEIDSLIQDLKEGDPAAMRSTAEVLEALAEQGIKFPEEALGALIQALTEDDCHAQRFAAGILGALAQQRRKLPEEVLGAFIQAIKEGDFDAKHYAADGLGALAQQGCKFPEEILNSLIQILYKKGDSAAKRSAVKVLRVLIQQKSQLPEEALGALIQVLQESDSAAKSSAAGVLVTLAQQEGKLSEEALSALIRVLKEGDSAAKRSAAGVLETLAQQKSKLSEEALGALIQIIKEGDFNAKRFAADILVALAQRGSKFPEKVLDVLIQALKEGDLAAKRSAARVLGALIQQGNKFSEEVLDAFNQILKEVYFDAKHSVEEGLKALAWQRGRPSEKALVVLIQAIKEGDSAVKCSAVDILKALAWQAGKLPEEALGALIQVFKEGDFAAKAYATGVLVEWVHQGSQLHEEALGALIQVFKEDDSAAKRFAAEVLRVLIQRGSQLPEEVLGCLIQILKQGDSDAKHSAAKVLKVSVQQKSQLPEEVLGALIQVLKEGDSESKLSAVKVLRVLVQQKSQLPEEALGALIQVLKEGDSESRLSAVKVLRVLVQQKSQLPEEVLGALIQVLKQGGSDAKHSAVEALRALVQQKSQLPEEALGALIQVLKEGDSESKLSAVKVLRALVQQKSQLPEEVVDALVQVFKEDDSAVKEYAAEVLGAVEKQGSQLPEEALSALIQVLKKGDSAVKLSAAGVLQGINKNALLKLSLKTFSLIAEACFFNEDSFSVKDQKFYISDKRTAYLSTHALELNYKEIREKLPSEIGAWRKRLDSIGRAEDS